MSSGPLLPVLGSVEFRPTTPSAPSRTRGSAVVRSVRTVLSITLPVVVMVLIALRINVAHVASIISGASLPLVLAACAACLGSTVTKALTWKATVDALPIVDGRSRRNDLIIPAFIGGFVNSIAPARLGDAAKIVLARDRLNRHGVHVGAPELSATFVMETGVATVVWGALSLIAAPFISVPWHADILAGLVGAVTLALMVAAARCRPRGARGWGERPRVRKVAAALFRVWEGLHASSRRLATRRLALRATFWGLGQWLFQWLAAWFILIACGHAAVGPGAAAAVVITLTFANAAPGLPGNVGTYEAAVALPLIAAFGMSPEAATAVAVAMHLTETAVIVAIGGAFAAALGMPKRAALRSQKPVGASVSLPSPANLVRRPLPIRVESAVPEHAVV